MTVIFFGCCLPDRPYHLSRSCSRDLCPPVASDNRLEEIMSNVPVQDLMTMQYMPFTEHKTLRYGVAAIVAIVASVFAATAV